MTKDLMEEGAKFSVPEARRLSDGSFFAEQKIKFRDDLYERTRNLLHKIESGEMFLRQIDKRMANALNDAARGMVPADLMALNEERAAAWADLLRAKTEMKELIVEKRKILEQAGLDWTQVPIAVDDLPSTQQEFACRLHGTRQPMPDELMSKMLSTGLLKAIPRIDDKVAEEVTVRLKSDWLEDRVVEIKKHFSDGKEVTKMSIVEPKEAGPTATGRTAYDVLVAKAVQAGQGPADHCEARQVEPQRRVHLRPYGTQG